MNRFISRVFAFCLVVLFLAMSFVAAEDSIGPYNPIADVNKDGVVDILDLVEVGQSYGSNYPLRAATNKTVVTVLNFARDPPEIEGALVSIGTGLYCLKNITDSQGTAVFELNPNTTYTALAFYDEGCNHADFTTNSKGEASLSVILGLPSYPVIRNTPNNNYYVTFRDNVTGAYLTKDFNTSYHKLAYKVVDLETMEEVEMWLCTAVDTKTRHPVLMFRFMPMMSIAYRGGLGIDPIGIGVLTLDENYSSYLCFYGNFSSVVG